MVGASDGRTYEGEQQFGVSIFDFKIAAQRRQPLQEIIRASSATRRIPGLGEAKP